MRSLLILLSFLIFTIVSCHKKTVALKSNTGSVNTTVAVKGKKEDRKIFPDPGKFTSFIQDNINAPGKDGLVIIKGDSIFLDTLTINIYKENNFSGFWNDSAKCHEVIRALYDSRFDGLNPKDYGIPELENLFKVCFMDKRSGDDTLYWKLELSVTKNYLHYLNHLRFGKTDPAILIKDWDYKRDPHLLYTSEQFSEFLKEKAFKIIKEFRPQLPMYNVLRSVLFTLDSLGKNDTFEWDHIPYIGKDLQPGDTSWVIPQIKHRLLTVVLGHQEDLTNVFNQELLDALNYFQQHEGVTPNGKIDKPTINKLNFTLQETEDVVRVNMERCRWLLLRGELPDYYIIVNVADFTLRIYKNYKQVYKTKVVVGATNKETPLFHSKLTTIELNPHWTVPVSISNDEILPKLKVDPDYLARNNMELMQGDSAVYVTNFSSYTKNNFPFVIRQKPGNGNSLGLVKFLFPNPYSVYFHDTPSKALFEKDVRAFSHGCIRVAKPLDLAGFIIADQGVSQKQISEIIETGKNTPIVLKTRVPIIITYWTCFTDPSDHVFFFKDIYGRDKLILRELNK